jgi:acyl-CoA thioester hydrolase
LRYGDSVIVETHYRNVLAAKIIFDFKIFQKKSSELVAVGSTTQVFVDAKTFQLQLTIPPFFERWKEKYRLA